MVEAAGSPDDADKVLPHIEAMREELRFYIEHLDEILPKLTKDEVLALAELLKQVKGNRDRGGPSLN